MHAIKGFVGSLVLVIAGCALLPSSLAPARQALAPQGELRVAFLAGPLYASRNLATNEYQGVAVDLGRALAERVGVAMRPVVYSNPAAIVAGAKSGEWDVALIGVSAERAAAVDFSAAYMEVEQGYLVRAGLPVATPADVDRPGIRVGVVENAGADKVLSGTLKNATLVRAKSLAELTALFESGKADVLVATKTFLFGRLAANTAARVLDEHILVEPIAMAVPKGRDPRAAAAVAQFVEEAKRSGLVKSAIERAGLRGVSVAALANRDRTYVRQ